MKFADAIDDYIAEKVRQGRLNSKRSIDAYRACLELHCDDVSNRDPAKTGRQDVKRTLGRWPHPNSQRQKHAILTSFYGWCCTEGIRDTNPALNVVRAKAREVTVFRPTLDEVVRLMDATDGPGESRRRERWVIHLGVLAGLRRDELRQLQGRHLVHEGWVRVTTDIAKRGKERWVPVLPELALIAAEIRERVAVDEFVIPSRRRGNPGLAANTELPDTAISATGLYRMVKRVGERAGLGDEIGPHTLRHAFGDHVARYAGLRAAQALLGHSSVATTEASYVGRVSRDELAVSVHGFAYRRLSVPEGAVVPDGSTNAL